MYLAPHIVEVFYQLWNTELVMCFCSFLYGCVIFTGGQCCRSCTWHWSCLVTLLSLSLRCSWWTCSLELSSLRWSISYTTSSTSQVCRTDMPPWRYVNFPSYWLLRWLMAYRTRVPKRLGHTCQVVETKNREITGRAPAGTPCGCHLYLASRKLVPTSNLYLLGLHAVVGLPSYQ